jgi:hypothetical protein
MLRNFGTQVFYIRICNWVLVPVRWPEFVPVWFRIENKKTAMMSLLEAAVEDMYLSIKSFQMTDSTQLYAT